MSPLSTRKAQASSIGALSGPNEHQRLRYKQDVAKLLALRKTFEGKTSVDVRGKEWRSIKLEPGVPNVAVARGGM